MSLAFGNKRKSLTFATAKDAAAQPDNRKPITRRHLVRLVSDLQSEREQTEQAFIGTQRSTKPERIPAPLQTSVDQTAPSRRPLQAGPVRTASDRTSPFSRSTEVLDKAERDNMAAYVHIIRQLDSLEAILASRSCRTAAEPVETALAPIAELPNAPVSEQPMATTPPPEGGPANQPLLAGPVEVTVGDEAPVEPPPVPSVPVPHIPQVVTDGVVSREQMADSLFVAGETRAAMDIYDSLLKAKPSADDAAWYHYQMASCLRKLDDASSAARHLRIVAGQSDAESLATYAKWWLDSFENKSTLRKTLTDLNSVVDGTKEQK